MSFLWLCMLCAIALSCVILFWRVSSRSAAVDLERVLPLAPEEEAADEASSQDASSISWVSFYLATDTPWSGDRVVEVLKDYDLSYEPSSGLFVYETEHMPWFRVAQATHPVSFDMDRLSDSAISGLAFFMDATEVDHPAMAFKRMLAVLHAMSQDLNALIVDQSQRPVMPGDFERILRQLPETVLLAHE